MLLYLRNMVDLQSFFMTYLAKDIYFCTLSSSHCMLSMHHVTGVILGTISQANKTKPQASCSLRSLDGKWKINQEVILFLEVVKSYESITG